VRTSEFYTPTDETAAIGSLQLDIKVAFATFTTAVQGLHGTLSTSGTSHIYRILFKSGITRLPDSKYFKGLFIEMQSVIKRSHYETSGHGSFCNLGFEFLFLEWLRSSPATSETERATDTGG